MAPISAASDGAPYADALRREIMRSEQQRMRAVAIILVFLLLVTVAATGLLPELSERLMDGGVPMWMPVSTMGPFIVYEIVALLVLRWRMAHDRDFPMIGRFVNALVETSLPGAIVYVMGSRMAAHVALGGWPPLLFFIFILLSTLRLDFWLSVWTGIVAAVELLLLANWLLPLSWDGPVNETFHYHSSRSLILLLGGVVAGLVAVSLRRQFENSVATAAARDRVTNLFGQHVSPAVVDRLLETSA
ncbi:MAG: adenylate/guanylate cyclase domain-containing protein, partial [Proteobacteria bacterium]|nr:adenylate/guanylate cyclase domain-containing protein [Pseudomonadota bacterium]